MTWSVVPAIAINQNGGMYPNYCIRVRAASSIVAGAGRLRVRFSAPPAFAFYLGPTWVGKKGVGSWDFSGDQVQLHFGGNTTATISAGQSLWSDWADYVVDDADYLIVSMAIGGDWVGFASVANDGIRASGLKSASYYNSGVTTIGTMTAHNVYWYAVAEIEGDHAIPVYVPVESALVGIYGLYEAHLEQGLVGQYHLLSAISSALIGQYSLIMEQALVGRYGNAPQITSALIGRYGDAAFVQSALVGRYGDMVPVLSALEGRYHLMHDVASALVGQYAICGSEVISGLVGRYDLKERNEIISALEGYYSLMPGATISRVACGVLVGGVAVAWSDVSWTISEDNYLIEGSITLRDGSQWQAVGKMDPCTITWMGTTYHLFVAAKTRSRSIGGSPGSAEYGADYGLIVRSLTNSLDAPHALPVTLSWPVATMASQIAIDLLGLMADDIAIDWQLEDWLQPGGTFFVTEQTPLEGLRSLAAIAGGIVQSGSDPTLIIRAASPVPPADWSTTAPSWIIEQNATFSDDESEGQSSAYNVITVTNQADSAESVRFETETLTDYRSRIKGYRTPWADFGLATSGGSWVMIEDEGIVTEQITETVEFVDGSASASKPIYSAVAVAWLQTSLGGVTPSEDGSLTAAIAGCSLASITYTTQYHAWVGATDRDETVQFYQVPA